MKKFLTVLSVVALIITSCSKDDEQEQSIQSSDILLTKTITTNYNNAGSVEVATYEYSGNKLLKISYDDGSYMDIIYSNNLITGTKYYESNTLSETETYGYDSSDRLTSYIIIDNIDTTWGSKRIYSYNSNGTVNVNYYYGDAFSQTIANGTGILTFTNNEITQDAYAVGRTITYTYDDKNNPFVNVTGFNKIWFFLAFPEGVFHNLLIEDDSSNTTQSISTYTYNSNDYPVSRSKSANGFTVTTQFFYNN